MNENRYEHFQLCLDQPRGNTLRVQVLRSPAGETAERIRFPYNENEVQSKLLDLRNAIGRSVQNYRRHISREETTVREFGATLFDAIFSGDVRNKFDASILLARQSGIGLRISLQVEIPYVANLPWEYLFDVRRDSYLNLVVNSPIVRYLPIPQPLIPLRIDLPLKILAVASSPIDLRPLNIEKEKSIIERALVDLISSRKVEITWIKNCNWRTLQSVMRQKSWHILHFVGHGGFDSNDGQGYICLESDSRESFCLTASQLADLLTGYDSLRLIVLNNCESGHTDSSDIFSNTASTLLRRGIPSVVAMQDEITDESAIEFSQSFYSALADGLPVDIAMVEARKGMSLRFAGNLEWGIPVLYVHCNDTRIFEVPQAERDSTSSDFHYHSIDDEKNFSKRQSENISTKPNGKLEDDSWKALENEIGDTIFEFWKKLKTTELPEIDVTYSLSRWFESQGKVGGQINFRAWLTVNCLTSSLVAYLSTKLLSEWFEFGFVLFFGLLFGFAYSYVQHQIFKHWVILRKHVPGQLSEQQYWWTVNIVVPCAIGLILGGLTFDFFGIERSQFAGLLIGSLTGLICGFIATYIIGKWNDLTK